MPRKNGRRTEEMLRERLQYETSRTRPAFSEQVHQRLCDEVLRHGASLGAPQHARERRRRIFTWTAAAATVAALLTCAAWLVLVGEPSQPSPSRDVILAESDFPAEPPGIGELAAWADLSENTTARLDQYMSSTLDSRWGYLDRDARSAVGMLAKALPVDTEFLPWFSREAENTTRDLSARD